MLQERSRSIEVLSVLCLTGFFLWTTETRMGINLYDDSFTMMLGNSISPSNFIASTPWSPLYASWFHLLSLVCPNPVVRYFLSWSLISGLIAIIPTLMKIPAGWIYTIAILALPLLTANPFVGLFAGAIVLCGLCIVVRTRCRLPIAAGTACFFCFVLSFCRPEFEYGVFVASVATVIAFAIEIRQSAVQKVADSPRKDRRRLISTAATVILVSSLSALMFFVMAHSNNTERSGMAFAQHYNLRAREHGLLRQGDDPWRSNYVERVFNIDTNHNAVTGQASLPDFYHANPRLFFSHILENARDRRTIVLLIALLALILWPWVRQELRVLRPSSAFLFLISLPPLTSILFIYPREHYAMILVPSLLLYTIQLLKTQPWIKPSMHWFLLLGVASILFFNFFIQDSPGSRRMIQRTDRSRVQCVRELDRRTLSTNPFIFDAADIIDLYLVHPRTTLTHVDLPQWSQFTSWAIKTRPAWIAIDPDLAKLYSVTPSELDRFLQGDLGYTPHACPARAWMTIYSQDKSIS